MKLRLGHFSLMWALASAIPVTGIGMRRCLGFCHLPLYSARLQRTPLRWLQFPPILDRKRNQQDHDENDESLFRELYESQQNKRDDSKDYAQLSLFLEESKSQEPKLTTGQHQGGNSPKPSQSVPPDALVQHLLNVFSEADDNDDIQEAVQEAFRFTSLQEFDAIQAIPSVRKSWKWGQPSELLATELGEKKRFSPDSTQQTNEGVTDADFYKEIEEEYAFLIGCDSFSFVGLPVFSETGRSCHVDVVIQKVESIIPNFYDKGVRTLNVVRSFRFSLERPNRATAKKGPWMVYNVKRISFAFHRSQGPDDKYDTEI